MDRTAAKSIIGKVDIKSTQDIDKILPYCLEFKRVLVIYSS